MATHGHYRLYPHRSWDVDVNNDDDGHTSLLGTTSGVSNPTAAASSNKSNKLFSFWSVFLVLLIAGVLFLVGFFLGYFVRESFEDRENITAEYRRYQFDEAKLEAIHENVMYFISRDPDRIKTFSREFGTADPLTNSVLEKKLEHTVYQQLVNYNFDSVDIEDYNVVVTYPDPNRPNRLEVLDQSGSVLANFTLKNAVTRGHNPVIKTVGVKSHYAKYPYVAFSKAGSAEGGLLFGHYGRQADLLELKHHGIDVTDHLLLLRLGEISVDEKVSVAEKAGAGGVLLYWDPSEGNTDVPHNRSHIPYASARPETGNDLHNIPVQTVSANMAAWLFGHMGGESAPQHWMGGLNVVYMLGRPSNETKNFKLTSYNKEEEQSVRNVIGSIHGYLEPDRYILIGAPRSGFPGSSNDAVLATSMLLQLARSLEYVYNLENWKPRRGIKLVSWGGHEFSQAGKTEYIKANSHLLDRRAIAYFDLSQMTLGNHSVRAEASPGFYTMIRQAAARVPDPTKTESTIADAWPSPVDLKNIQNGDAPVYTFQRHTQSNPFLQLVGIPELHVQYVGNHTPSGSSVTNMATLDVHHHFKYHIAVTRVITLAALHLVDDAVLPISLRDYAEDLHLVMWQTSGELKHCSTQMEDLESEVSAAEDLLKIATAFDDFIKIYEENSDKLGIHSTNEVKMMFERIFITASRHKRHHLLYPQVFDGRITTLSELCHVARFTNDWVAVHSYISALKTALQEAARCLRTNE
ncbi:glutamate carboxypeptidase 2-like [Gigantopelta aegis]|uniref:glutamate carboxypeptidase 2-like n=1 Tax=Gigantopelta aegis TaxID=1735272 RepID=UPI001B887F12|nr:glutamate carboxypeptidase 2-like [Gigantopelta aegis]